MESATPAYKRIVLKLSGEALRETGVQARVLLTSSALVYRPSDRPLTEADPLGDL
jgi:hypothetical protein